ncbi:MAG: undecaprenyldiphospho-muramoylpentapeptide beta-N-acetylglucosaminyltransferase [Gammaproteobacteria bacterium]
MVKAPVVCIMAGGTGGHVFPGLALAERLVAKGYCVQWLGTPRGMEAQLVPSRGITLHTLPIVALRGKGWRRYVRIPFTLVGAVWQAVRCLRKMSPLCVIGMGGYVAGPGGLAAYLLRIPLVVHEQNAVAGLTNRLLAPLARYVLTAYPNQLCRWRSCQTVGNPLRDALTQMATPTQRYGNRSGALRILVLGGSLGAQALNEILPRALGIVFADRADRPIVWHQAGRGKCDGATAAYDAAGFSAELASPVEDEAPLEGVRVAAFISDVAVAYAWADLVICRAGALTVSELSVVGVAAVLVPYPHAVDDHQTQNAQFLVNAKAALCVQQAGLSSESFAAVLGPLLQNRDRLRVLAEHARAVASPDATDRVVSIVERCCVRDVATHQ